MKKIIKHPRTNAQVALSMLEFFKIIILTEKYYDYATLNFVVKFLIKLSTRHSDELLPVLKKIF